MRWPSSSSTKPGLLASGAVVALLAILVGLVAATGFVVGVLLVAGLLLGAILMMAPMPTLMVVLLLLTFVVQGLAVYFLRLQQAAWIPYLLCLLLSIKTIRLSLGPAGQATRAWSSPPMVCLFLYFFSLLCAFFLNNPSATQVVIGMKNALPIWVAAALMYSAARVPAFFERMWRVMKTVFFLQLPVTLYQHFVIVPSRKDASTTGMDAVVGTFGGLIDAGGANATLVTFTLFVMAYQLALWNKGAATLRSVALYWTVGMVIIVSGEVKAALLWIPLVILYVLRRRVLASFGTALASALLSMVLVTGLFASYSALYWQEIAHRSNTDLIESFGYFFDSSNVNYRTGEISRGASLALWVADPKGDIPHRLVGYGPGASRISATGGLGEVARRYAPLNISATSTSQMLWDTGLLGMAAFCGLLFSIFWMLTRQGNHAKLDARERACADAFGAATMLMLTLVFYNNDVNNQPSVQLLLALALGCTLHWRWRTAVLPPKPTESPTMGFAA